MTGGPDRDAAPSSMRADKWLWHARFFKSRSLAARMVGEGKVRVNGTRISKPSAAVTVGDVLTFTQARQIRVVRVEAISARRGPAGEAQALYTDLDPPSERPAPPRPAPGFDGKGRPTKQDRRAFDLSRRQTLE